MTPLMKHDPPDCTPYNGVIDYIYTIGGNEIPYCMQRYLNELQLDSKYKYREQFTKDLRKPPCNYKYCLSPQLFAFLITWQRVEMFITDKDDIVSPEIVDFLRDLARNEVALSTDPIPKRSVLGAALIALGLDTEYTLTDNTVKE